MKTYSPDFAGNARAMQRFDALDVAAVLTSKSALEGERAPNRCSRGRWGGVLAPETGKPDCAVLRTMCGLVCKVLTAKSHVQPLPMI